MNQIQILILIGITLLGLIGYIHYIVNEQKKEIKALWLQISVIAAATAKEFSKYQKIKDEIISVFNTLTAEIIDLVEEKAIDYVVMGTKGATGAKEVLFGSNTVHVFKSIKCAVLAIPQNFKFETPHEILFPTDYEIEFTKKQLQPLIDVTSLYISRVNILNVSYGYELSEIQEKNKKELEKLFENTAYLFHSVANESVPEAISEFQLRARINLLVMINNKHSFFENLFFKNTVNQIGFHLNIPFLLIPAKTKKS